MDDERIDRALRAGPADEPRYSPLGRPAGVAKPATRGWPSRLRGAFEVAASVALVVVFVAGVLFLRGRGDTASRPDLLATIQAAGRIRIAVTVGSPQVQSPGSGTDGLDLDVARAIGQRLGVAVEIDAVDPAQIEAGAWNGLWDLAIDSAVSTDRRAEVLHVGAPYYTRSAGAVVADGSTVGRLADLAGAPVCVVRGGLAERWTAGTLDLVDGVAVAPPPGLRIIAAETVDACLAAVNDGSAASFIADWAEDVPVSAGSSVLADIPFTGAAGTAVDPAQAGSGNLLAEVDRIVAELRDDGTLRGLSERRFGGRDLTILPGN